MRLNFFCSLLLLLAVATSAAPASRIFGAVDSKAEFSGDRLFAVLDSVGGPGTWMEWDVNGVQDPSVIKVLDPMLKSNNKPKMVWVLSERIKPLLAVLLPKGRGEAIVFYELVALDAKPVPLKMNRVLSPDVVFRDYRAVSPSEFVHLDRPSLKVVANDKSIRFTYENRDGAFVQSTRALFNWQPWHWYMASFNSKAMISDAELEAILSKGVKPSRFTIFKTKAVDGQWVEFKTDGNGFYEMLITNP